MTTLRDIILDAVKNAIEASERAPLTDQDIDAIIDDAIVEIKERIIS